MSLNKRFKFTAMLIIIDDNFEFVVNLWTLIKLLLQIEPSVQLLRSSSVPALDKRHWSMR